MVGVLKIKSFYLIFIFSKGQIQLILFMSPQKLRATSIFTLQFTTSFLCLDNFATKFRRSVWVLIKKKIQVIFEITVLKNNSCFFRAQTIHVLPTQPRVSELKWKCEKMSSHLIFRGTTMHFAIFLCRFLCQLVMYFCLICTWKRKIFGVVVGVNNGFIGS